MNRPVIVPVGGFLGAGKTTLLITAAQMLARRGLRPALILNDQGDDLVDTGWTSLHDIATGEVTGGCFCCRFSDFVDAADRLREADVIFAEPVGSCTDLGATILQPLKSDFSEGFRIAPLTVLVDPFRVDKLRANSDTAFLFEHQLAEADLVCFTRSDTCQSYPELRGVAARRLSGRTGEGVEAWLDEVLFGEIPAGEHILEIDYERYAAAEAALAWCNCTVKYEPRPSLAPAMVIGPLLDELDRRMTEAGIQTAHLKVLDRTSTGALKAAITSNGDEPVVEGDLTASPAARHQILVNIRAIAEPDPLESIVRASLPAGAQITRLQCFRPAAPKPERRAPFSPAAAESGPRESRQR